MRNRDRSLIGLMVLTLAVLLLATDPVSAYIGPGAGLELVPYFMALLVTVGVAFMSILLWPIYAVIRFFRGPKPAAAVEMPALTAPSTAPAMSLTSETASSEQPASLKE